MFIPEETFIDVINATPLVSIDLVIRNCMGSALLGKRVNRPAQGSWFVPGGRIRKNEKIEDAIVRISEVELGFRIPLSEAKWLGAYDHLYPDNFLGQAQVSTHYVVLAYEYRMEDDSGLTHDCQHEKLKWWHVDSLLDHEQVHGNTKAYFRK
jgi:colanic acid biosynthesis protein WcaH